MAEVKSIFAKSLTVYQIILGLWCVSQWFIVEHDNFSHLNLNNHTSNHTMEHEIHYANGTFIKCTLQDTGKWMSWTDASVADINSFKIGEKMKECHPPMDVLNELTAFNMVVLSGFFLLVCSFSILIPIVINSCLGNEYTYAETLMTYVRHFSLQLSLVLFVSTVVVLTSIINADDLQSTSEMEYKCFEGGLCPPWMFITLAALSGFNCLLVFIQLSLFDPEYEYGDHGYASVLPTGFGVNEDNKIRWDFNIVSVFLTMCAVIIAMFAFVGVEKFKVDGGKPMISFWILIGSIVIKLVMILGFFILKTTGLANNSDGGSDMWWTLFKGFDACATITLLAVAGMDISHEGHAYASLIVLATLFIARATFLVSERMRTVKWSIRRFMYLVPVFFAGLLIFLIATDDNFEHSEYNATVTVTNKKEVNSHEYVEVLPLLWMFALIFSCWKLLSSLFSFGSNNDLLPYSGFSSSALLVILAVLMTEHNSVKTVLAFITSCLLKLVDLYYAYVLHIEGVYNEDVTKPGVDETKYSVYNLGNYLTLTGELDIARLDNVRTWIVFFPMLFSCVLLCTVLGTNSYDNDIHGYLIGSLVLVCIHLVVVLAAMVNDYGKVVDVEKKKITKVPHEIIFCWSKIPLVRIVVTSLVLCLLAIAIQKQGFDRWTIGKEHDYTEKYLIEAFFMYGLSDAAGFLFM